MKFMNGNRKRYLTGIFFIAPISIIIFTFLLLPILQTMYYSFTDWRGVGEYSFIGLKNYINIFNDSSFKYSLLLTIYVGLSIAFLTNVIGLTFALVLDQALKTKNILRTILYLPNVIPIVVAAFVWRYILDYNNGLANKFFSTFSSESIHIPWIDSPDYVVPTIIMISTWQMIGPVMIVYLAALQGVPLDLIEAAKIDGASKVKRFLNVTLPMIAPGITVNILIGLANGIRIFDLPYALTGGGPAGASETLAIKIYRYAFQSTELSYGMAASFIMTLVALVITLLFVSLSRRYERNVM
ncbi:carbohydrate ABC transporter permease [Pseudogracilibacillus auburnensis]|uniref:Carbohydrate ABC transporter membrane protein 1 (CUT1 family) n=1 Tax=Pseudogracilibacillus auburnensis TaxID=1494959 RepID=A0A2V3W8E4_9BACI|nr:sugar ABC transporter permease [Pseudogracilibacillus auburnensis]PXW90392.1 carbohydrate ABC transporter membrane protein 1 (CUT1 family) [Pseudogracilibacillus auburnensis]